MQSTNTVLQTFRGVFALCGHLIDSIAQTAIEANPSLVKDSPISQAPYHITLLTKAELRKIPDERLTGILTTAPESHTIHPAGVGGSGDVFFIVIIWARGQHIRKQLGLRPKHFHITLSASDDHEMDKGIDSLFPNQFPLTPSPDFLDHLAFTLQAFGEFGCAEKFSEELVLALPDSAKGFLRLADAALSGGSYKLAMLSYACAYDRSEDDKAQSHSIKKMIECSKYTEWGHTMLEDDLGQISQELAPALFTPWSTRLRSILSEANLTPTLRLDPRRSLFIPTLATSKSLYKLPRFFRWLIPFYIAIMSTPRNEEDISTLASPHLGIRHILTLTEEEPLGESWFRGKSITNTYLPVPNYCPPSIEQMDLIITLLGDESKLPLLIHCGGGKGRAGTVAASYIAAFGFSKPRFNQAHPEISAQEAVSLLRQLRPGSIETSQQEDFVSKWCSTIWKRQSVYPDRPTEPPPCPLVVEGSLDGRDVHDLFVLVGLPGSGKSWFSKSLLARNPSSWTRISQDDSGSRSLCEVQIGRSPKEGSVLLDRCNTAASDRRRWLDLASNWCTSPICIWFDYNCDLCISRAQLRAGHPTLPPGNRVRNAVDQMQKVLDRPRLAEGFSAIVIIRSFEAARELVTRLSPIQMFKFPRTPHLLDLGAATSDDIVTDVAVLPFHDQVVITEKIDGANMGFSLSSDRSRIVVQNRSHYVDSSIHEQFKKLDVWVENHRTDLYSVLDRDPFFPERYILFGEWMYATHSIAYTHLPDHFIAFGVYDRSTNTWAGRRTLSQVLARTSISVVPVLHQGPGPIPTNDELRQMIQTQSKYWDGRVEGVYIKVERNDVVIARGKVVRSDFIAGNKHWTKGKLRINGVVI